MRVSSGKAWSRTSVGSTAGGAVATAVSTRGSLACTAIARDTGVICVVQSSLAGGRPLKASAAAKKAGSFSF